MRIYNLPEKVCAVKAFDDYDWQTHRNLYPLSNCRVVSDGELSVIVPEDVNQFVIFWEQYLKTTGVENNVYLGSYAPDDKPELYRFNATADRYERWSSWYQRWAEETPPLTMRDALSEAYSELVINLA